LICSLSLLAWFAQQREGLGRRESGEAASVAA
jgi:hypothetical protein